MTTLFGSRVRPPERIQVGGDHQSPSNQQISGHEMVSLDDSKPLPAQTVREIGQDIVMGDCGATSSNPSNTLVHQDNVILPVQDQDNRPMMIKNQPHSRISDSTTQVGVSG